MSNQEKVYVYLETPITFEEKRKWNAKGYRVADIKTMPKGYNNPFAPDEPKEPEVKPAQAKTRKAAK